MRAMRLEPMHDMILASLLSSMSIPPDSLSISLSLPRSLLHFRLCLSLARSVCHLLIFFHVPLLRSASVPRPGCVAVPTLMFLISHWTGRENHTIWMFFF